MINLLLLTVSHIAMFPSPVMEKPSVLSHSYHTINISTLIQPWGGDGSFDKEYTVSIVFSSTKNGLNQCNVGNRHEGKSHQE